MARQRYRPLFMRIMWYAQRLIAFRDKAPDGDGSGMPCGACREFLLQLSSQNKDTEIMVDYQKREIVTLKELMPNWWGYDRYNM